MTISKLLSTKSDIKQFKFDFTNKFESEVINNFASYDSGNESFLNLCDFLDQRETCLIESLFIRHLKLALKHNFGEHDFMISGNRDYHNYVLTYQDLTFVVAAESFIEVIIPNGTKMSSIIDTSTNFKKELINLTLKYCLEHKDTLSETSLDALNKLETNSIISIDGVNFNYFENKPSFKP